MNPSNDKTLGYTLTALILYIPANLFPFMTMEMYGVKTNPTIWSGIISLSKGDSWYLGVVVFIASMLVPFLKLLSLFYLSLSTTTTKNKKFKLKLLHFIDKIGPWSMLDIFLLAVMIAVLKIDLIANVEVGPGSFMFLLVVIFTIMACSSFNKTLIEESPDGKN